MHTEPKIERSQRHKSDYWHEGFHHSEFTVVLEQVGIDNAWIVIIFLHSLLCLINCSHIQYALTPWRTVQVVVKHNAQMISFTHLGLKTYFTDTRCKFKALKTHFLNQPLMCDWVLHIFWVISQEIFQSVLIFYLFWSKITCEFWNS